MDPCREPISTTTVERASDGDLDVLANAHLDPYALRHGFKSRSELDRLNRRRRDKHVKRFYERQNDVRPRQPCFVFRAAHVYSCGLQLISSLLKPMDEHTEDAKVEQGASQTQVRLSFPASAYLCLI